MPKLYFYDAGLAAYLLGISSAEQITVHPLRGALFESFIISELLKMRFNRGMASNLYFWRNNTGDEIDVVAENGDILHPLEIKSGQTVVDDFFSGLKKWRKFAAGVGDRNILIYGGSGNQKRSDTDVLSWRSLAEIEGIITG